MALKTQKRVASRVLKCGENRIWIDPARIEEVEEAITTDDVKRLIREDAIKARPKKGTSRVRARKIAEQKSKGKRKGPGKRKGKKGARYPKKKAWMRTVRSLRKELKNMKENNEVLNRHYREIYKKIKGGMFRSKHHMRLYMRDHGMIKEENNE